MSIHADVGLDTGDDDLISAAVLDRPLEAVVAGTGEGELARRCVAERGGEALHGRTEALRVLLAGQHRNVESAAGFYQHGGSGRP